MHTPEHYTSVIHLSVISPLFPNDDNIQHPHKLVVRRKWWVQIILHILLRLLSHCSGLWCCLRKGNYIAISRTGCSAKQKWKERKIFNSGQGNPALCHCSAFCQQPPNNRSTVVLLCLPKSPGQRLLTLTFQCRNNQTALAWDETVCFKWMLLRKSIWNFLVFTHQLITYKGEYKWPMEHCH